MLHTNNYDLYIYTYPNMGKINVELAIVLCSILIELP